MHSGDAEQGNPAPDNGRVIKTSTDEHQSAQSIAGLARLAS